MSTVLLTGASGFVGAHTVHELLRRGHRVRALVRSPGKLGTALSPLGVSADDERLDVVTGDMTDAAAVTSAAAGCDAVIHAAAVYSFKRRDRQTMLRGNVDGTRLVLEAGRDAGATHLVHVSSTVALTRQGRPILDHRSPLGPGFGPYSESKVASERVARTMQQHGDPVTIVNPGGVLGPHDPYVGESNAVVLEILKGKTPVFPRGRVPYVDVRDAAATLAAAIEVDPGGRYVVPGEAVARLHEPLREVTGRDLPCRTIPAALAIAATTPGYLTGWSFLPGAVEGVRINACGCGLDHSETTRVLGVEPRPLVESLADTVAWLKSAGHLGRGRKA